MKPNQSAGLVYYRYADLVALGIVNNRMTLSRWQQKQGFPKPVPLGPNTRGWVVDEVKQWQADRAAARAPSPANGNGQPDAA